VIFSSLRQELRNANYQAFEPLILIIETAAFPGAVDKAAIVSCSGSIGANLIVCQVTINKR